MKKNFKAILTVCCAAVLAFNLAPVQAKAEVADTASLAIGDNTWAVQWFGETGTSNTAGATGTDAVVTGVGQYTVSVDFTGTEQGYAAGAAFIAPVIANGEADLPGYMIQIDSIVVNGEELEVAKGYSNNEDGALRTNVINDYVTALPDDARTPDGVLDDATWNVIDESLLAEIKTMSITFTVLDAEGNDGSVVEDTATTDDTAATDDAAATTDVPKTGVVGLGLIYGLGAIATGAAALKRKEK